MPVTNAASGTSVHEIASGIFRISTPVPPSAMPGGFTFNQILVVDDEPLLFHTGPRRMFPLVREAVTHVENPMRPGERKEAVFSPSIDVLLHRLGWLDLSRATRVGVTVSVEETGDVLFQTDDAPFDREAGEVLIACQKHFSALPPNIVIGVRSRDASGNEGLAAYAIPHVFV